MTIWHSRNCFGCSLVFQWICGLEKWIVPRAEKFCQTGKWLQASLKSRAIQESREEKGENMFFFFPSLFSFHPFFCFLFIWCIFVETWDVRGNGRICSQVVEMNLFYLAKQSPAVSWARQDVRRYVVRPGSTIHHFKHIVSSPANTAAHPRCRRFPAPGPRPVIHYTAVFLSHLVARTKPYAFVSFVILCQVGTAMGSGISSAFIRGSADLRMAAMEVNFVALNIACPPLVRWGTETPKCVMTLLFFVVSQIWRSTFLLLRLWIASSFRVACSCDVI